MSWRRDAGSWMLEAGSRRQNCFMPQASSLLPPAYLEFKINHTTSMRIWAER